MAELLPSSYDRRGAGAPGDVDEAPIVELTAEQLYGLCAAVAWSLEDDDPAAERAAVRRVLAAVEERLLSAWADVLLGGWDGADAPRTTAGGSGVA